MLWQAKRLRGSGQFVCIIWQLGTDPLWHLCIWKRKKDDARAWIEGAQNKELKYICGNPVYAKFE